MVLTLDEFQTAQKDTGEEIKALLTLRTATSSFLIQCLADREIQKEFLSNTPNANWKAYRYNCEVIHRPAVWNRVI